MARAADEMRIPAIYPFRFYVQDGALLAYGFSAADQFKRAAVYASRIQKGEGRRSAGAGAEPVRVRHQSEYHEGDGAHRAAVAADRGRRDCASRAELAAGRPSKARSSLALVLLFWQWRPLPAVLWHVDQPQIAVAITGLSHLGWLIVLSSTFLINHFELFGLHQVANNLAGRPMAAPRFRTPLYYKFVRHPIYLGLIIAFWATPTMTVGHLLFAAVTTAYIVVGILLEEHDLIDLFGDDYRRYRKRVSMLLPWRKSAPLDNAEPNAVSIETLGRLN